MNTVWSNGFPIIVVEFLFLKWNIIWNFCVSGPLLSDIVSCLFREKKRDFSYVPFLIELPKISGTFS